MNNENENKSDNEQSNPQLQVVNSKLGLIIILLLVFGIPLFAILQGLFFGKPAE